jgi:3-oxoacyl-[acyl-carrier-protein] synthase II
MEAIVTIESLLRGVLPPTAGCDEADPDCPVDVILGAARPGACTSALSTSAGFWGSVAALLFVPP